MSETLAVLGVGGHGQGSTVWNSVDGELGHFSAVSYSEQTSAVWYSFDDGTDSKDTYSEDVLVDRV